MTTKRKVLLFAVQFYPESTGYSFAASNFVKSISDKYDITVMTPVELPQGIEELPNIKVIRGRKNGFQKYFYQFKILFPVLKTLSTYDAIFFDTAELFFLGNIISRLAPEKTILRFHGCMTTEAAYFGKTLMMRVWKFFIRKWVRATKIITSTTPFYIDFVKNLYLKSDLYQSASKNFSIIPNTIFVEDYNLPEKSEIFKKYGIKSTNFNMLTLGRMDNDGLIQKGIEDVMFALKLLKDYNREFTITVIGNGNKKKQIEELVKSLGIESNVNFISKAQHLDILALSKYVDATVLYSRFEGMSMFALESVSLGCFPIFSNVGGLKDLVINNESGFLVESQNIPELANKIIDRMEMNDADCSEFRENSRQHFQNNFTPELITEKFDEVMNFIVPKRKE